MWVAERLVSSEKRQEGEKMMDVAERYLGGLAHRYMIQVRLNKSSTTRTRFKSCRLHDLMRDLCLSKMNKHSLKVFSDSHTGSSEYLYGNESPVLRQKEESMSFEKQRARQVRSLLLFSNGKTNSTKTIAMGIKNFELVRVLVLDRVHFSRDELPEAIGNLQGLRYLSVLKSNGIINFPPSLRNLRDLETLNLRTRTYFNVPNVLWNLEHLRHLYLPANTGTKILRLDELSMLETLVNFESKYCNVKDLIQMNNLQKLKSKIVNADMGDLANAPNLLLQYSNFVIYGFNSEIEINALIKWTGRLCLHKLNLHGQISKLPELCHFSPSLIKLTLWGSYLKEDPMPTLGKLPSLISLYLHDYAFVGEEMVCSAISFPLLTSLKLYLLPFLQNWRIDEGAFPKLCLLEIGKCKSLKTVPDGLTFITNLKKLVIYATPEVLKKGIREAYAHDGRKEGEDFPKGRGIPFIKIS